MKKTFLLLALLGLFSMAEAVEPMFIKGDKYINIGVGLNWFPEAALSFDYGLVDVGKANLAVGAYGGMGFESGKYHHIFSGLRGTIHYPIIEDIDTYVGGCLGLCFDTDPWGRYGPFFIKGVFLGANYPLTKNIIVFGEVGSGIAHLHGGLTIFF